MIWSRVLVVDDDALIREAIADDVARLGYKVEAYPSGEAFLAQADLATAGAVILDLRMPGVGGLEVLAELRRRHSPLRTVLLSGYANVPTAVAAARDGAIDVIEKPYDAAQLAEAIERTLAASVEARASAPSEPGRLALLTNRERTVIEALARGGTNRSVAEALGLSPRTVEMHRAKAMNRLGSASFADAIRIVFEELKIG